MNYRGVIGYDNDEEDISDLRINLPRRRTSYGSVSGKPFDGSM